MNVGDVVTIRTYMDMLFEFGQSHQINQIDQFYDLNRVKYSFTTQMCYLCGKRFNISSIKNIHGTKITLDDSKYIGINNFFISLDMIEESHIYYILKLSNEELFHLKNIVNLIYDLGTSIHYTDEYDKVKSTVLYSFFRTIPQRYCVLKLEKRVVDFIIDKFLLIDKTSFDYELELINKLQSFRNIQ